MASGAFTGYQHFLLDKTDLTKKEFIDFCDDAFYHLNNFGISLEEGKSRMKLNQQERLNRLEKEEREYQTFLSILGTKELKEKYQAGVQRVNETNNYLVEKYKKEMERMALINKWSIHFPQLDQIWLGFKKPELRLQEVAPIEWWVEKRIQSMEESIQYLKKDIEKYAHTVDEESWIVSEYEAAKHKFIKGACHVYERN